MRSLHLLTILGLLAVPLAAQTTGVPFINDLTINGAGSGGTSCVDPGLTTSASGIGWTVTGTPGALIFGVQALSGLCTPGVATVGPGYTLDIDPLSLAFFLPSSIGGFQIGAVMPASGTWSLSVTTNLPLYASFAFQFALVTPWASNGIRTTQAHAGFVTFPPPFSVLPDTIGGDLPGLSDHGTINFVLAESFTFYGVTYSDVYVNMNGNLTFTSGDTDFTSSEAEMLAGPPRIAATWDDWTPSDPAQGTVRVYSVPQSPGIAGVFQCEWFDVRHFGSGCTGVGDSNTFGVSLSTGYWGTPGGPFAIVVGGMLLCNTGTAPSTDQVVGISPGGGISLPNNVDLSFAQINATVSTAIYEDFSLGAYGPYDLGNVPPPGTTLWFLPNPTGGYALAPF